MAFAGNLGAQVALDRMPHDLSGRSADELTTILLFSESNTRFVCEVPPEYRQAFESHLDGIPHAAVGQVVANARLLISRQEDSEATAVIDLDLPALKNAWQSPLRW
jgi:phosphoribosylformylglycinamidine synthase